MSSVAGISFNRAMPRGKTVNLPMNHWWCVLALPPLLLVAACTPAWANVYASALEQTAPNAFSYVLNEDATVGVTMEVWKVGGGMVYSENLGPRSRGTQTWAWNGTGFTADDQFTVRVNAAATGYGDWTQIVPDQTSTSFYVPVGLSVNKHPLSPDFGKIYVSNSQSGTTAFGRPTASGIYVLKADASQVGLFTGGKDWEAAGTSSPFKSTIGPDDHLYVADFSNDLLWEFSPDMSSLTQLIDASNKTAGQYVESIHVEGTQAAGNRKIYLVNSNYNDAARKGLIQYNLGGSAAATPGDLGIQYIGPSYFAFYPRDVARDSAGDWYLNQYRYDPTQAPAITKFADSATLPINTAVWETPMTDPYNGAYGIDLQEAEGWVAYGNYYDGFVQIFRTSDGSYVGGFDAGSRLREVAFDTAGNIYTVDSITEWLRIWSPAGANSFTTESYFTVVPEPSTLVLLLSAGAALVLLLRWRAAAANRIP
jgi:hypothetical protein